MRENNPIASVDSNLFVGAKLFVCFASTQQQTANGFVGAMAILVILNSDVMTTPNYTSSTNITY